MVGLVLNFKIYNKSLKLSDLLKYPIKGFSVTFFGQILKKVLRDGMITKEESVSFLEPMSLPTS